MGSPDERGNSTSPISDPDGDIKTDSTLMRSGETMVMVHLHVIAGELNLLKHAEVY